MKRAVLLLVAILILSSQPAVFAKDYAPIYPGFPSIRECKAYKKFSTRTYSEFSKILYMIDRFSDSQILINYDDQNYTAAFSTTVARWFLSRNYKKQTAREWIKQWCNKSILSGKPIYVKLPDGKFLLAREVLSDEVEALEQVIRENQNKPVTPDVFIEPVPAASIPSKTEPQAVEAAGPVAVSASTVTVMAATASAPAAEAAPAKA